MAWKYLTFSVTLILLAISSTGTAQSDDELDCGPCTLELNPHCASNGRTYGNRCHFRCAQRNIPGLTLLFLGTCRAPPLDCPCDKRAQPVCGSDGRTYSNPCLLECGKKTYPQLTLARDGECNTCICPWNYDPVCGSDGKTYPNACGLGCAQNTIPDLTQVNTGECVDPSCGCPRILDPRCGTNGRTYANLCILQCAQRRFPLLEEAYRGRCVTNPPPPPPPNNSSCLCTRQFAPVCGNDGITYGNQCALDCARRTNPSLRTAYKGECRCDCPPQLGVNPHCASDGVTYPGRCQLNCAQRQNRNLTLVRVGACPRADVTICRAACVFNPVCGRDGRTYDSGCAIACARETYPQLRQAHVGACQEGPASTPGCVCPAIVLPPVCGTNGVTYDGYCGLQCAEKINPDLKLADAGRCPARNGTDSGCQCNFLWNPVCGSDGVTYPNPCVLRCAQRTDPTLRLAYEGECRRRNPGPLPPTTTPRPSPLHCTEEWNPVCGNDGITYGNLCSLKFQPGVELAYFGICKSQ